MCAGSRCPSSFTIFQNIVFLNRENRKKAQSLSWFLRCSFCSNKQGALCMSAGSRRPSFSQCHVLTTCCMHARRLIYNDLRFLRERLNQRSCHKSDGAQRVCQLGIHIYIYINGIPMCQRFCFWFAKPELPCSDFCSPHVASDAAWLRCMHDMRIDMVM